MSTELVSLTTQVGKTLAEISAATDNLRVITDVSSDSDARAADMYLTPAKTLVKVVHDQRMSITRRVDAFKKSIIAEEASILASLNSEIERVKSLQIRYVEDKQAAVDAADAERARENHVAEMEAMLSGDDVVHHDERKQKLVEGVTTRTTWSFRIVDPNLVPRAYCCPDEAAIRAYMSEAKRGGTDISSLGIPGVEFFKKVSV